MTFGGRDRRISHAEIDRRISHAEIGISHAEIDRRIQGGTELAERHGGLPRFEHDLHARGQRSMCHVDATWRRAIESGRREEAPERGKKRGRKRGRSAGGGEAGGAHTRAAAHLIALSRAFCDCV